MTTTSGASGSPVPGYLGRVLHADGAPAGTCFQISAGVLVTACHVLDEVGAASKAVPVQVDPLGGGQPVDAVVARLDPLRDLAVLTTHTQLPEVAGELTPSGQLPLRTKVNVTGHVVIDDPGHVYKFLDAAGEWAGGTTRDDAVPLGRLTSADVMPGMSGAPVIRASDGAVAGVVSGRYNTADNWLTGTVWVARTEDLRPLLDGIAEVGFRQPPLAGAVDVLLTITPAHVELTGAGLSVRAGHGGVRPGLEEAVRESRRARAGLAARAQAGPGQRPEQLALSRVGQLLGESFLPGPISGALGRVLAAARRAHQPVRLGLAVPAELAGLPWETLPSPDGGGPLALRELVSLYRKADAPAARVLPGPLRIVVAIASPDGGGVVLDYERELRNVLAAVRAARQDAADVRVVPFATPAAIREELDRGPAHVLHISGHGAPGILQLENQDGTPRPVTAGEFVRDAIPPGQMPPVITLAACYTGAAASEDGASFAAQLCARGAAAVIATETSITDTYATRLLARVYGALARSGSPDVVAALADARREVQAELAASPDKRDNQLAGLGEWAAVTVLAASGSVTVVDPGRAGPAVRRPSRPRIPGLAGRDDWYFVGRRREQRRWPLDLTGPGLAGIAVTGIGGTGKTTLAAEIATRVRDREPGRILVGLRGPLTLESVLGAVTAAIRRELLVQGGGDQAALQALDVASRSDLGWQDRLAVLREHVLDPVPVLLLLDNFEDNLTPHETGYQVRDQVLAALLAAWVADPGASRLLVTSRYAFTLPGGAEQGLSFRQLGALSRAETWKLAWSLPALDRLDEGQLEQVWRLAGGHPRSLEYLDALLSGGDARYPDVTARLGAAIGRRLNGTQRDQWLAAHASLDAALAEIVALAADDVLLDDLLTQLGQVPGAAGLLAGISVYREPVDDNAVLFQAGQPDPSAEIIPDRRGAWEHITGILAAAGIPVDDSLDLDDLPGELRAQLGPHRAELNRPPDPPVRPVPGLRRQLAACQTASLLTGSEENRRPRFFVHRWTATELAARTASESGPVLAEAHRRAAGYWQWRVDAWPQDRAADVHDLLEARYHLLQAGDLEAAGQVTELACSQLQTWGAWDQEASLIHDTLTWLPENSSRRGAWIHHLGMLAQARGDYAEAARQYQRSLDIKERLDDQAGMAASYHQLGALAQSRGDYAEAVRQYQRSLDIEERLGNQAGMAASYHNLGLLAQNRGDYEEATRQTQRALDISERLGNQASMAASYHNLGILAQNRGDYAEAARQYQRSLDTFERLGDRAGMATSYHNLGILAQNRGDYAEATRQTQRALDISERLGNQASTARIYGQLGLLAQLRGDYEEAARQTQRALDTFERLGDQAGVARSYHQLGSLAQDRGDYAEAARQYQRSLDTFERLGDQAGMATSYHNLGILAQDRGDYAEAARQYQRALDINERLGNQAGMATSYSQLGSLVAERGGPVADIVAWHIRALAIHLRIGVPQAVNNLRQLLPYRRELGAEPFAALLAQITDDAELVEAIPGLLDQVDASEGDTT